MLKKLEKEAILKNHRILTLETIYDQMPQFRDLESNKRCHNDIENINFSLNTRRYILSVCYSKKWMKILHSTERLTEIYLW